MSRKVCSNVDSFFVSIKHKFYIDNEYKVDIPQIHLISLPLIKLIIMMFLVLKLHIRCPIIIIRSDIIMNKKYLLLCQKSW